MTRRSSDRVDAAWLARVAAAWARRDRQSREEIVLEQAKWAAMMRDAVSAYETDPVREEAATA